VVVGAHSKADAKVQGAPCCLERHSPTAGTLVSLFVPHERPEFGRDGGATGVAAESHQ
jgi:hypothetical protein